MNITKRNGAIALPGCIGEIIDIESSTAVNRKNMLKTLVNWLIMDIGKNVNLIKECLHIISGRFN
jgi:hypothetical protein